MAQLAFLGLGIMGGPMARNLLRAGHSVALWSNTASKARRLAEAENGIFCETAAQAAAQAEGIFLCVGDSAMSEAVILGPGGVLEGARPGTVVIDASTVSPSSSIRIHHRLAEASIHFLGAPCTGSKPGAENGTLTFMIGGEPAVFERAKPWLLPMGQRLYFCGGPGMGLHAKLTQNLILSNILNAFNEGIVLSTKAGVDPELMLEILANSAAKCGLIEFKAPFILRRDFSPNFSLKWMHKDTGLMLDSAQELNVPLLMTALTRQIFQTALARGLAEEDMCSAIKVLEGMAGTEVKAHSK